MKFKEKGPTQLTRLKKNPLNYCEETETFHCNSCKADDWFDYVCSESADESKSGKKKMEVKKHNKNQH